jgi:hypothetical protein
MKAISSALRDEIERLTVNRDGYANAQRKQSTSSSRLSYTGEMAPRWVDDKQVSRCPVTDCEREFTLLERYVHVRDDSEQFIMRAEGRNV